MRTANPVGPGLVGQGPGLPGVPSRQGIDANWNRRYWVGSAYNRFGVGVRIPGGVSNPANKVTSPDHASLNITGDIDIRIKTRLRDWAAPGPVATAIVPLVAKQSFSLLGGYRFSIIPVGYAGVGRLNLSVYVGGVATGATSEAGTMPAFDDNTDHWLRVTRTSATGVVRFYWCPTEDGATWVQIGADQSTTAGAISTASTPLQFGSDSDGNGGCPQIISRVVLWNGIEGSGGSVVLDADFAAQATGTTSFVEPNGRTVTITSASQSWGSLGAWSEESGGVGGASLPSSVSDCRFDGNSGPVAMSTLSFTAICRDLDFTGFTGSWDMGIGNPNTQVYGSLTMSSAMTFVSQGTISFLSTTSDTRTIYTAGKGMPSLTFSGPGDYKFLDNCVPLAAAYSTFTVGAGPTVDTNGFTMGTKLLPWNMTLNGTSSRRVLKLGASTVWCTSWSASTAGLDINPGTSTINLVGVGAGFGAYGGQRYNIVAFPAVQSTVSTIGGMAHSGAGGNTEIAHLIVRNVSTSSFAGTSSNPTAVWIFGSNNSFWRITDMTIEGQPGSPVLVQGVGWGSAGSAINVANAPTLSNVTFTDTTAGGASAPWSGTRLGDGGGNTSITFPVSQTNYWVASTPGLTGTGLYCGTTNGSSSAGGSSRGTYATAPDSVPLSITGDIDLRVKFSGRICRETSGTHWLITKGNVPGGALRAYKLAITYLGVPYFVISTNGTTESAYACTEAAWPLSNYTAGWLRATRVAATGVVTFYTSTDGVVWTQLGATVTGATGNIFDSPSPLWIGVGESGSTSSQAFDGTLLRAQIYNGIAGTLAFDADFETAPAAALSFTESSVNAATVTVVPFAATSDGAHTDAAHWASSTGGASGSGRVPLAHDDVVYDGNSGTGRPQWDAPEVGRNVTGTGATVGVIDVFPRWMAGGATTQTRVWGSLTVGNLTGVTQTSGASSLDFCGRGSTFTHTIGSAFGWGDSSTSIVSYMRFYPLASTTHALGSALNTTWGIAQPASLSTGGGTFDAGAYDVTCYSFTDGLTTQVRTVNFGSGTWTLTGVSGTVLTIPNQANLTLAGNPTWVISESLDAVVKDGKWRVPQYGSDPSNTTRATSYVSADSTDGGNLWATPRPVALTGDLDLVVRFNRDLVSQQTYLLHTSNSVPSPGRSFGMVVNTANTPYLNLSTNGTTNTAYFCTTTLPFGDGVTGWMRVTRNATTGQIIFYTCANQTAVPSGGDWVQLGTTVAGPTGSLYAGKTDLAVGTYSGNRLPGMSVYHAQVSDTIGGAPVATLDFTSMDDYALSTTDPQGNVWRSYQYGARTTRRVVGGTTIGYTVGSSNVWATTDSAALSITSDLELVIRCRPSTWTPTGGAFLINKFEATGNQRSYAWNISATGKLVFTRNPTGSASNIVYTSTGTGLTAGVAYWLKMTYDQTDGAVSRCRFYYAADQATEPSVWTEIGTGVTSADVTGIYDSTAPLQIGIGSGAATTLNGEIWRAIVRNGIGGTTVFDADFSNLQDDTYAFRESSANNAVVYASSNGTAGIPGGRTIKSLLVSNKTLPGSSFTIQGGGGGYLGFSGNSNSAGVHGFPPIIAEGGKWFSTGDSTGGRHVFSAITWTTTSTGPRNALMRPLVGFTRWESDGLVTVSYADVLYNDADGASIPFHDVNGFLFGTTDWLLDAQPSINDGLGIIDVESWEVTAETSDAEGVSDALSMTSSVSLGDTEEASDSAGAGLGSVVADPLGLVDDGSASAAVSIGDIEPVVDATSAASAALLSDPAALSDLISAGVSTAIVDALGVADAVATALAFLLDDLLGETDEVSAEVIPSERGCAWATFAAPVGATSFEAPDAVTSFVAPTAVATMAEC